jgi:oxygen-dependent protoporphyrinogen oxidase
VFGGDVAKLSVRAVMPAFVAMEREFGSLVLAVQAKAAAQQKPIFTTLRGGMEELVRKMAEHLPAGWVRLGQAVRRIERVAGGWAAETPGGVFACDELLVAAPVGVARDLLGRIDERAAELMRMDSSSAVVVAFCFSETFLLPPGFGFLVPPGQESLLLACTFMDQKFAGRVPAGGRMVRAFFGGPAAERLMRCGNDEIASVARLELGRILGPLPEPTLIVVRRWPRSVPQYGVGHLERMAELERRVAALEGLQLLGNGYRGVGVPDLIRNARNAVDAMVLNA